MNVVPRHCFIDEARAIYYRYQTIFGLNLPDGNVGFVPPSQNIYEMLRKIFQNIVDTKYPPARIEILTCSF